MHDPELPTDSNSREIPPPTPFSWLPLFSNVTSRERASLVSHLITAIFSGPSELVTLQSHSEVCSLACGTSLHRCNDAP